MIKERSFGILCLAGDAGRRTMAESIWGRIYPVTPENASEKMKSLVYRFSQFLVRVFLRLAFGCRYSYEADIPRGGPLIVASNHCSLFDPPSVGAGVPREIYFMAKRELFAQRLFGTLIRFYNAVPVRRSGMDWKGVAQLKRLLSEGKALILFPEGTRQREGRLGEPKFGVGRLAQETGAVIVPAYARGTASLREAFLRRRPLRVCFGRPILPGEYAGFEATPRGQLGISALVMERIARLKEELERSEERG
ncbi:MAG: lysophospholipid acyltransferase family protein [Candidatus Glassbacteria bacterium]